MVRFTKKNFTFFVLLFIPLLLTAQKNKVYNPLRIEFQVDEGERPLDLANCGVYGNLMIYASEKLEKDTILWEFSHYDVNFELVRTSKIKLPGDIYFKKSSFSDSLAYIVLASESKKEDVKLIVVKYNLISSNYEYLVFDDKDFETFTNIVAVNQVALASYRTKNNTEQVISFNFEKDSVETVIDVDETDNSFVRFDVLGISRNFHDNGFLIFSVKNMSDNDEQMLSIHSYINGYASKYYSKMLNDSITPITASPIFTPNGQVSSIVGGYYDGELKRIRGGYNYGYKSSGTYSFNLSANVFRTYEIKQTSQDIYFLWDEAKKMKYNSSDVYVIGSEAYMPVYKTVYDVEYDYWGRPYSTQRIVLDGFSSFKCFNYVFDNQGKLLWSNSADIEGVVSTRPVKRSISIANEKEVANVSCSLDYLQYGICELFSDNVVYNRFYPKKRYKKDVVVDEDNAMIEYWYDNYYLLYGYQVVKNNSIMGKSRRYVFFMQKVALSS